MSCWALIPVKGFDRGKSRLAEVLDPDERSKLTLELFEHVVQVVQRAAGIDHVAVVSDSREARRRAEELGVVALEDPKGSVGLAEVVDTAIDELERRGATSVLVCMSDLPALAEADIESVIQQLEETDVVLVPDLVWRGTNVIASRPPSAIPSCLGHDDSLQRHQSKARERGLTVSVQARTGISFDVDEPSDLDKLGRR